MKELFKKRKITVIVSCIITVILGIVLIVNPVGATVLICRVAGFLLLMSGLFVTGSYFLNISENIRSAALIPGLIQLALGVWITLRPDRFVQFLTVIVGFVVLVHSFGFLQNTVELKRYGYKYWWVLLVVFAVTLVLGIITVAAPFGAVAAAMTIAGAGLVFDGAATIITVLRVDKFVRSVKEAMGQSVIETSGRDVSDK